VVCAAAASAAVPGPMPTRPSTAPATAPRIGAATQSATKPSVVTASRPVSAVQAETILAGFPRNAAAISSRSDFRALTLEGRVREVRTVPVGTGGLPVPAGRMETEVRVVLVAKAQAEEAAAHFTCHMDKATAEEAAALVPDTVIRLTGAIGGVTPAQDRIDLMGCHDLTVVGELPVAQRVLGKWVTNGRSDSTAAPEFRGHAMHLELSLSADGTFTEEVFDAGRSIRQIAGKWSAPKPKKGEEPALKFEPKNLLFATNPVAFEQEQLVLQPVGVADLRLPARTTWTRMIGTELAYDPRAMRAQVLNWMSANITVNDPQGAQNVSTFITDQDAGNYHLDCGGGAVKSGRATQVLVCAGKMFVLPYTDAQAQHANVPARSIAANILPKFGVLMAPEARIESLVLDNKNTITVGKALTGKATLRTFGRALPAQYAMMMVTGHGTLLSALKQPLGPDPDSFEFSFDVARVGQVFAQPDPLGAVFMLVRIPGADDRGNDRRQRVISEPIAFLMDVVR
jgi:hypothetical protein